MSEQQEPTIYPETYVYLLVGTNVAFLDRAAAKKFAERSVADGPRVSVLPMPAGYLPQTAKIVFGEIPEHKPADWPSSDDAAQGEKAE